MCAFKLKEIKNIMSVISENSAKENCAVQSDKDIEYLIHTIFFL